MKQQDLPKTRHMGVLVEAHKAEVHTEPIEPLGPCDVLLQMQTNNICTTDYQQWMGLREHQGYPMAGGHEWSGVIIAKGADVVDTLQIGDRVSGMGKGCAQCTDCLSGHQELCRNTKSVIVNGYYGGRGFSNYKVSHQTDVVKLNGNVTPAEVGFMEPVATVVSGIELVRVHPGHTVVVVGSGTMGLLNAQVAKAYGAKVIMTDVTDKKIERARSMGIGEVLDGRDSGVAERVMELTDGIGADIVIPAVGSSVAYEQSMQMLRKIGGRMLLFAAGYPKPELKVDPNEIHYRRMEIIGTGNANMGDFAKAAFLISNQLIDCKYSLEGKVFALRDIQQAFEAAATPDTYRITVDLQQI
ncbi:zinc-binding dehydrogenase [Eubacteriales bacterium OttesenSCG-928-N14]|nr:zinc-binding dehydrogenase [Eubacteriales bacterium OttesenSCG-928-N14]